MTYQLALVVESAVLGNLGDGNVLVEASNARLGLDEDGGVWGWLAASLLDCGAPG